MKTIAFFNHKGGVGKTRVLFNLAVALADSGKKVVLFDSDSQANLTALALPEAVYADALDTHKTIWTSLMPLVTGAGDFQLMDPLSIRDRLWLLPGDIRLSDFEAICPAGWTEALAGQSRGFRVTSALYRTHLGSFLEIQGRQQSRFQQPSEHKVRNHGSMSVPNMKTGWALGLQLLA